MIRISIDGSNLNILDLDGKYESARKVFIYAILIILYDDLKKYTKPFFIHDKLLINIDNIEHLTIDKLKDAMINEELKAKNYHCHL